jgi:MscS family membrane protein
MDEPLKALMASSWLLDVLIIIILTSLVLMLWVVIATRVGRLTLRISTVWDDALWFGLKTPMAWLIGIWGGSLLARVIARAFDLGALPWLDGTRYVALIVLVAWALLRFIIRAQQRFIAKSYDETSVHAIGKLASVVVVILAGLTALQDLGVSVSGLLAFGGMGGLIVGMGARDLLANFFGGMVIYLDQPFKVGDWVRSPDRDIEGTIESIGWRVTRIRTFDKRPIYVPNSVFSTIIVENPSRMSNRRIKEVIGVRYDDAARIEGIVAQVKLMLQSHPDIDNQQTLIVNLDQFGPSSLNFFIYTFTKTTEWEKFHEIKQNVLTQVLGIITQHGAAVAYPTQTLHLNSKGNE